MESFVKLFINLQSFSLKGKTLEEQYDALGIDEKNVFSKSVIEDALKKEITTLLTVPSTEKYLIQSDINSLRDAFYYADKLNNTKTYKLYFDTLQNFQFFLGCTIPRYPEFTELERWQKAIMYLNTLIEISSTSACQVGDFGLEKQRDRVDAVKRLSKHGVKADIDKNDIVLKDIDKATNFICNGVEKIGGVRFVETLLSQSYYNADFGRIIFLKQGNAANYCEIKPETPIAYLFNVGLSKTRYKGHEKNVEQFNAIVKTATDLCLALYPVQSYSIWEDVFGSNIDAKEYFRKWAIWDSIYNVPQSGVLFMQDMMLFLVDKLQENGRKMSERYSLQDYVNMMRGLLSYAKEKEFAKICPSTLSILTSKEMQNIIIDDIVADVVNCGYKCPLDYGKVTYSDFPAFKLPNGDIMLYPASIGVMAWYEVMMSKLREQDAIYLEEQKARGEKVKYQGADNIVGLILEEYVRSKLQEKGITPISGKYKVDGENGECDVVVENSNTILLMEMKKKNMTRRSREGYLFQIILDFAGSLFNSQEQAFRTETFLRRKGTVELDDDGTKAVLDYKDRQCEKMTITLNEYGPLHERVIISAVMENFMRYNYSVNQSEIEEFETDAVKVKRIMSGYDNLKKKQKALDNYLKELSISVSSGKYSPFFDSWFFSIEQLCYIISLANNVDELMNELKTLKFCTFGTRDFWQEIGLKHRMKV